MKSSFFKFNEKLYKQVGGIGTGLKLAPTYACLGMGKFENLVFTSDQELLDKILLWKRYIDDILMLFKGTEEECESLVHWLNNFMPGVIKFKYEFSYSKIVFLDLEIFKEDGKLRTSIHIKPTNKQLYLDFNSNHPMHCKKSIPYSQALRVVERCSSPMERDAELDDLKEKFKGRNYPCSLIDEKFEKAKSKDRRNLIFQKRKNKQKEDDKVRLILTHTQANPPIHQWMRECKSVLIRNDRAKDIGKRMQIGYKQPKNLQQLVGGDRGGSGGRDKIPPDAGCSKCNHCKVSCPIIEETKYFRSTRTDKRYQIKQKIDCDSSWVIYLSTCKKCRGQYVGKSQTIFKKRHSNHKREIKNEIGGLGHHYGGSGGCGYQNVSITLIEEVKTKTPKYLAERELFWQHQLRVFVSNGSRGHCYRKDV